MKQIIKINLIVLVFIFTSVVSFCLPKLNSLPTASATIFLDFDGNYVNAAAWNWGTPFNCLPSGMTDAQVTETFNRVAEDYRPFNINVTTDSTIFLAAPLSNRIRIIVTTTSEWCQGVGGIAYVGSFIWGDDTPAFVFCDRLGPNNAKMVAEACSHESGHTLGLSHQSRYDGFCNLTETYNSGAGTGETSWAPVMGNSYYRNMTGWENGPTPYDCAEKQDNLSIITSQNGFTYREDDFSEILNSKTFLINAGNINLSGVITTPFDKDAFKIVIPQRNSLHISAKPFSVGAAESGANLDIKLILYNSSMQSIRTYDPTDKMSAAIDTILNSGTYFLVMSGTGNKNTSEYGSLGSYTITGNTGSLLPIHEVKLNGKIIDSKHDLNWEIISNDPIKSITVETSNDGVDFKTITTLPASFDKFSFIPFQHAIHYYRLKVISVYGQIVYSNIVTIKNGNETKNIFTVSNLVKTDIIINASKKYQYILSDMNARIISSGVGASGINRINIGNKPDGMYILKLLADKQQQTIRIVKQ